MAPRRRIVLIGLALAAVVYLGLTFWYHRHRATLIGLTDQPCRADGRPVTGNGYDDWAALCRYRAENLQLASGHARPEVVMIGDSLTELWPGTDPRVANRGVMGQTSAQVLLRFRQDALALQPRVLHILLGTNDVLGVTGPVTLDQFEGNLLDMTELAQLHGAVVILGTIPPIEHFATFKPGEPARDVARVNAAIRNVAASRHLILADYHAALVNSDGSMREELFESDGIHLTAKGYAKMQAVFDEAVARARAKAGTQGRT